MSGGLAIARTELMDWHDEMRERAFDARFSPAIEKETTMTDNTPLPRGPFEEPSDAVEPPDLKADLEEAVIHLAACRQGTERAQQAATVLHEELAQTDLGKRVSRISLTLSEMKQIAKDAESEVRSLALAIHEETAERRPHPAVQIKKYTVSNITDQDALFDHVRIHVPRCVKLDRRAVTQVARVIDLPGVVVEDEYRTTISTKLDKWLPNEEGDNESSGSPGPQISE